MERDSHDHDQRRLRAARLPWRHWLLAAVLAFLPGLALALGLGPIEVRSHLNEPLDAVIPLTEVRPDEIEDLTVSLAPLDTFQRLGLEITPALRQLRFKVKEDGEGGYVVQVTSLGPIQEPFLTFVVALEWPKGRLLREYTVLLDPPLFTEEQAPSQAAAEAPQQEAPTEAEPLPELTPAPAAEEPSAPAAATSAPAETESQAPFTYGPVRPGETLSTIAQRVHPPEVTLDQMMIALYEANPDAFYGNINRLKAGSVLRLDEDPRTAAARIDPDTARAEVIRQYQAWRLAREGRGEPALVSAGEGAPAPKAGTKGEARLELVVPEEGSADSAGGGGELAAKVAELERRLALANEAMAAAQKENEHLAQRVSALEEQVAALQRLVALRDEQLARLGAKVPEAAPSGQTQALAVGEGERSAAPAPPPATLPPRQSPSIWQDPVILSALVGGGSLLLLGGWFLWYRRRTRDEDEEWTQTLLDSDMEGSDLPSEVRTAAEPEPASEPEGGRRAAGGSDGVPSVPSVPSEPASQATAPAASGGEIDPLAEADVYLAYGSYDQARAVIDQALEAEPDRLDLLQKRLEIAYNERDVDAFCHYAEAVLEALGGDTDRPEWQQVRAMGEDLVPDHPWFREHTQLVDESLVTGLSEESAPAPATPEGAPETGPEAGPEETPATEPVENPDEVTLFAEDSELPAKEAPETVEKEAPGGEAGEGLRLEPLAEAAEPESQAAPAEEAPSVTVSSELDLQPLESVEEESEAPAQEAPAKPAGEGEVTEEEFDGNAFFVFTDEVGTKLDLARAYIEMGDKAGAKELLEEVLEVGDENQRAEAEELLRQLD